jgi:hypothetical protein
MKDNYNIYKELRTAVTSAYFTLKNASLVGRFKSFIEEDNRARKLAAYELQLNRKSEKLQDKIKAKENKINAKRLASGLDPIDAPCTKRLEELRYELKDNKERLKKAGEVIDCYKRLRYQKVSYAILFGEEESKVCDECDFSFHETRHNLFILSKKAFIVLLISAFSMLQFTNIIVNFSPYTIFRVSYSLFSLALSVYLGVADGTKFVSGQMCDVLRRRINYVQGFIEKNQK